MSGYDIAFSKEKVTLCKSPKESRNSKKISNIFSEPKTKQIAMNSPNNLRHFERRGFTILDGGMGRELHANYPEPDYDRIWSAAYLLNQPESVYKCHLSYIKAGAEIITTSNYTCVPIFLERLDVANKMYDLIKLAGEMALKAKQDSNAYPAKQVKVAGSLSPFGFSFIGSSIPDKSKQISSYAKIAQTLFPFIDLFLCETMSSIDEAVTVLGGIEVAKIHGLWDNSDLPVWLSFSLEEGESPELHSGEMLEEALRIVLGKFPGLIDGLFLNCCAPKAITAALPILIKIGKEAGVNTFGAYANRFSSTPNVPEIKGDKVKEGSPKRRVRTLIDISVEEYLEHVRIWIYLGCTVVGGCCGIGPEYIGKICQLKYIR